MENKFTEEELNKLYDLVSEEIYIADSEDEVEFLQNLLDKIAKL